MDTGTWHSWLDEEHPALEAVGIVTTHSPVAESGPEDDAVQLN